MLDFFLAQLIYTSLKHNSFPRQIALCIPHLLFDLIIGRNVWKVSLLEIRTSFQIISCQKHRNQQASWLECPKVSKRGPDAEIYTSCMRIGGGCLCCILVKSGAKSAHWAPEGYRAQEVQCMRSLLGAGPSHLIIGQQNLVIHYGVKSYLLPSYSCYQLPTSWLYNMAWCWFGWLKQSDRSDIASKIVSN
jgi:hypothetical protein